MDAQRVVVHIDFDGEEVMQNVLQVPYDMTWVDFELLVKLTYDVEHLGFSYMDEENEEVSISSQEEFEEAMKVAHKSNDNLHLKLKNKEAKGEENLGFIETPIVIDLETETPATTEVKLTDEEKPHASVENDTDTADQACADAIPVEPEKKMEEKDGALAIEVDADTPAKSSQPTKPKTFFLKSAKSGLVIDVCAWGTRPGTPLILFPQKTVKEPRDNQLFYVDDKTGTIRSLFSGLCVDASGNHATMNQYEIGKTSQQWMVQGNLVHHRFNPNWVLTAMDEAAGHSTRLHAFDYKKKTTQHWVVEYAESVPRVPNRETGEKTGILTCPPAIPPPPEPPRLSKHRVNMVKGYYSMLARQVGRMHGNQAHIKSQMPRTRCMEQCNESGEMSKQSGEEIPPGWFYDYMDKFKAEIAEDISRMVTRKTVHQVLRGLEGAVISALPGSGIPTNSNSASTSSGEQKTQRQMYCHYGVVCDNCEQTVMGSRYKCGNCEDFDLCEACENLEGVHDPDHVFIKIRRPTITAGRKKNGKLSPLLKKSLYATKEEKYKFDDKVRREEKKQKEMKRMMERMEKKEEHREERQRRREEKLKRRLVENRDHPMKKERLDLPQFQANERMEAQFLDDANLPDGTHVQPGTRLTKRWVVKNTGTHSWTSATKLTLMWGNIPCVSDEVSVPYIEPEQTGYLAVELVAPEEPGVYQSHWRLHHHGERFGHRVWCSIVVDPREVLEPEEDAETRSLLHIKKETAEKEEGQQAEAPAGVIADAAVTAVAQLKSPSEDPTTTVVDSDILTAQDILSFEMLDIRDRNTPKVSQTATPNNTPLAVSPPKSPTPELVEQDGEEECSVLGLSNSSSVELVSEASVEDLTATMTELVQERIAALGLKPDLPDRDDIETLSSCSSHESDEDFYIVPLPDCFNPDLPPSTSASTSVIVPKESSKKSVDEILTASNSIETELLTPTLEPSAPISNSPDDIEVVEIPIKVEDVEACSPDVEIIYELPAADDTSVADVEVKGATADVIPVVEVIDEKASDDEPVADIVTNGAAADDIPVEDVDTDEGFADEPQTDHNANVQPTNQEPEELEDNVQGAEGGEKDKRRIRDPHSPSPGKIAASVLTTAIGVASHCAASAYCTAKDVFKTLQAKDQYVPTKSNWTPPKDSNWTLPKEGWTPPAQDWTPPKINWTPPKEEWALPPEEPEVTIVPPTVVVNKPETPMDQLIEMGFADREVNKRLLEKHEDELEKVIQELVSLSDHNWHQTRHGTSNQ